MSPPQQSEATPQLKPRAAHVVGPGQSKPHWCPSQPNPHMRPVGQTPQSRTCPQVSSAVPQLKPCDAQVFGKQLVPHTPGVPPPPQVCGAVQLPQSSRLPQPSPAGPQLNPNCAQVFGQQSQHALGSTTQCWPNNVQQNIPPAHVPQSIFTPQPSSVVPHVKPSCWQVSGTHPSPSMPASPPELVPMVPVVEEPLELEVGVVEEPPEPELEEAPTITVPLHAAKTTIAARSMLSRTTDFMSAFPETPRWYLLALRAWDQIDQIHKGDSAIERGAPVHGLVTVPRARRTCPACPAEASRW